jgi:hypothetical protein
LQNIFQTVYVRKHGELGQSCGTQKGTEAEESSPDDVRFSSALEGLQYLMYVLGLAGISKSFGKERSRPEP